MQRYDSYKDSGIFWQPQIPNNWIVKKLGYVLKKHNRPRPLGAELLVCTNKATVIKKGDSKMGMTSENEEIYQGVAVGDLLIHGMDTWHGAIAISKYDGMCTPVVHVCTSEENVAYISYYLRNMATQKVFKLISNGVRQNTSDFRGWDKVKEILCPIPPLPEQQAIASYLDTATAKIDEAIAQQQKMIDLLNERKQIIINNAVTKGINPNAKMKPSGIDWIGNIPEHWDTIKIKYLLNEIKDRSATGQEEPLSMSQKYGLIPTKKMDVVPNMASSFVGAKIVGQGDLVFNKLKAHLGVFATSDYEGLVSPDYAVYKGTGLANLKYLEYIFKTPKCIAEFVRLITGVGSGLSRLYTSDLYSIYVPLPSMQEQLMIVEYIDSSTANIKTAITNAEKQITLLQERKQIIINDVVTGKVKVLV